jgi:hypothetical protein
MGCILSKAVVRLSLEGANMNQRRRLTGQEREEVRAEAHEANPGKEVFVQEWTDVEGKPIIVTILPAEQWAPTPIRQGRKPAT